MKTTREYETAAQEQDNENSITSVYAESPTNRESETPAYGRAQFRPHQQRVIDLLLEIREKQMNAATAEQLEAHDSQMLTTLREQKADLQHALESLQHHLDAFSIRNILTVVSLVCIAAASFILLMTILSGPVVLAAPIPHFMLLLSVALYFMSRFLPARS
jgi:hypothetical protein